MVTNYTWLDHNQTSAYVFLLHVEGSFLASLFKKLYLRTLLQQSFSNSSKLRWCWKKRIKSLRLWAMQHQCGHVIKIQAPITASLLQVSLSSYFPPFYALLSAWILKSLLTLLTFIILLHPLLTKHTRPGLSWGIFWTCEAFFSSLHTVDPQETWERWPEIDSWRAWVGHESAVAGARRQWRPAKGQQSGRVQRDQSAGWWGELRLGLPGEAELCTMLLVQLELPRITASFRHATEQGLLVAPESKGAACLHTRQDAGWSKGQK